MSTKIRFPEPRKIQDPAVQNYLNSLVRALNYFDEQIFSTETGNIFNSARVRPSTKVSGESSYTVGQYDSVILVNSSASDVTVSLPTARQSRGTYFDIKKIDVNGGTSVSVVGSGPEFPKTLTGTDRPNLTVFSDGEDYWVI